MDGARFGFWLHLAGGALVFWLYRREMRRRGLDTEGTRLVALAALVGGLLGALLLNFPGWLAAHPADWRAADLPTRVGVVLASGRTWIGGLLGGFLLVEWTKRRIGLRRSTGDAFALALPLGEAVGRLGCLAAACCYGAPAQVPWAVFQHGAARHPTQVYSALLALLLYAGLRAVRDRLPREGDLFRLYLAGYAVTRFGVETLRDHGGAPGLSAAQWACLAGLGVLAVTWAPGFVAAMRPGRAASTA